MHLGQFMDNVEDHRSATLLKKAISMPEEDPESKNVRHEKRSSSKISLGKQRSSEAVESSSGLGSMLSKLAFGIFGPASTEPD